MEVSTNGIASNSTESECSYNPNEWTAYQTISVALMVLLTIIICGGNSLIFVAFARSPKLKTMTNFYIIQLAITDLALGLVMPFHIVTFIRPDVVISNIGVCLFRYISFIFICSASVCGLAALTYDRYFAITDPLHYHDSTTTKRYVLSSLLIWLMPLVGSSLILALWHNDFDPHCPECQLIQVIPRDFFRILLFPAFVLVTAVLVGWYYRIFSIARSQMHSVQAMVVVPVNRFHGQMKLVKAGLIVFATFYICWLPFFTVVGLQVYSDRFVNSTVNSIRTLMSFVSACNSAVNPVIYAYRLPLFKHELRRMFGLEPQRTNSTELSSITRTCH